MPVELDVRPGEGASIAERMQSVAEASAPALEDVQPAPAGAREPQWDVSAEPAADALPFPDLTAALQEQVLEPAHPVPVPDALEDAQADSFADAAPADTAVEVAADDAALSPALQATPEAEPAPETVDEDATADGVHTVEDAVPADVPSFVKQAQRKAWWSKPAVRFAMGMLVILLPLALLLQVAIHERNALAAWKPAWRPALETLCVALRCELSPRKDIAAVALMGSAFVHNARPHHYRLDVSIRNQSALAVATPAVELTLTDTQDQVLVRKVLNLAEIGAPSELAAHSEWNGTLPVKTQGLNLPVSGYRVMAFYP